MFTGLIDDVGVLQHATDTAAGRELRIRTRHQDLVAGESIAVNGVCLTVRTCGPGWFDASATAATRARTMAGAWQAGAHLNLERAMRVGDRLGGHIVQGHVDGVGTLRRVIDRNAPEGDAVRLVDVSLPEGLAPFVVLHGSIALDGVSLTVNALPEPETIQVALIEYTLRHTTLERWTAGDLVHVEADVIGKYVHRLATLAGAPAAGTSLSL
jgi:riboflavin synthase